MLEFDNLELDGIESLERPLLVSAYQSLSAKLDGDGLLDRTAFTVADIKPFMHNTSLFELIIEGNKVTDLFVRILSSQIANDIGEVSGKLASDKLPPKLVHRWLRVGQHLYKTRKTFRARADVYGKKYKHAESLVIPVKLDGKLTQVLVVSEYWMADLD